MSARTTNPLNLRSGDRLVLSIGGCRRVWTVSAVNNQVVKYFDENQCYGQMPLAHLTGILEQGHVRIETGDEIV